MYGKQKFGGFVEKRSRVATVGAQAKGLGSALKKLMLMAMLLVVFGASVNFLARYAAERIQDMKMPALPSFNLFGRPVYLINQGNLYVMYSDMKTKMADSNIDRHYLPYISGVAQQEKRPEYIKALKQAVAVKAEYLTRISEVSLRNPSSIIFIHEDGGIIEFGDSITAEKLDKYMVALKTYKELGRKFKKMDLRFDGRVILN